jgi:NitT/TauT family transport system substrate-binding protein
MSFINHKELMTHGKSRIIFYFLVGLSIACSDQQRSGDSGLNEINIGVLNGPSKVSMVKMIRDFTVLEENIKINYVIRNSPDPIISDMVKGELEFAVLPTTSAALLYNRGVRYRVLGIPIWGSLSLAGTRTDLHRIEDLKGKTIYLMGRGKTPDIVFRYLLHRYGMIPGKDVSLRYTFPAPSELANAMRAGIIEIGIVSEPHTSIIIGTNPMIRRMVDITQEWELATSKEIPEFVELQQNAGRTILLSK